MIYTTGGIALDIALRQAALDKAERLHVRGPYGREFRRPIYLQGVRGGRAHEVGRDKNGDVFPIYREVWK